MLILLLSSGLESNGQFGSISARNSAVSTPLSPSRSVFADNSPSEAHHRDSALSNGSSNDRPGVEGL